ncbi:MAG: cyclic nucleotide-binding domain-containing protein [Deltaproteobacteria bacterium]|nr:cyclic nucleotide-binding domain-containing protein [Deltaproteobacteria bacterium]
MALDFFAKRKLRKEIKQLENQISKGEDRPDLLLRLAGLHRKLGNDDDAKEQYYNVTRAYLESNKRGQAEAVCKSVLEFYPGNERFLELFDIITGETLKEKTPSPELPVEESISDENLSQDGDGDSVGDEDSLEDDDVAGLMDGYSEPDEPTPVAEYNSLEEFKQDWRDEDSDPDSNRIPSPPMGVPTLKNSLQESLSSRFSAVSASSGGILRDNNNDEVLDDDSFFGESDDFFSGSEVTDDSLNQEKTRPGDNILAQTTNTPSEGIPPHTVVEKIKRHRTVELEQAPLIKDLPSSIINDLFEVVSPVTFEPLDYIVREGDTGTSLYVILSGEVNVTKLSSIGEETLITTLKAGEFFGEFALLADHRRHASIVANSTVEVIEIPKTIVVELGKKHPELIEIIKRFYRHRLMDLMIKSLDFFNLISADRREKYLGDIHFHRFAPGTPIIRQGQKSGGFFLIMIGEVEIIHKGENGEKLLGVLGEGEYFGEMALMKRQSAMATVKSRELVELVQIPAKTFFQILADHPQVWRKMQEEVKKRELLDHYFISGRSSSPVTYST